MNYKKLIVDSGLRMAKSGLTVGTYGNISARDPETGLIYLTPSAMSYDTISEEDVVVVDLEGNVVEGSRKPTSETPIHLAIYRARTDVNAIIHTHPIYSMVYAAMGRDIPLFTDQAVHVLFDTVRCTKEHYLTGSDGLADSCVEALGNKGYACLVRSHGAIATGVNMEKAFIVCTILESSAQVLQMIEATGGKPVEISDEDMEKLREFITKRYGQNK